MQTSVDDPRLDGFSLLCHGDRDTAFSDVESARRMLMSVSLAMIAIVDSSGSYRDDGHRNIVCWVTAVLNTSRSEANALVDAARLIRDHPTIGAALADGHVGMGQLTELARLHGNVRVRPVLADMPDLIAELIEHASLRPLDQFRIICKRVERNADPDGTLDDHERARSERRLTSTRRGTSHRIIADGDAVSGAVFEGVLATYVQAEFDRDWADGRRQHGDQMTAALMARTDRQRRYDAFMVMTRAAADALEHRRTGTTNARAGAPVVVIHTDADTITDVVRDHNTGTSYRAGPSTGDDLFRRGAETADGAPVSDNDLFIALLLGNVQRVIHDPADGHIIDLGRKRRLFTGAARTAALADTTPAAIPAAASPALGCNSTTTRHGQPSWDRPTNTTSASAAATTTVTKKRSATAPNAVRACAACTGPFDRTAPRSPHAPPPPPSGGADTHPTRPVDRVTWVRRPASCRE